MHTNLKSLARSQLPVVEMTEEEVAEMIAVAVADVAEAEVSVENVVEVNVEIVVEVISVENVAEVTAGTALQEMTELLQPIKRAGIDQASALVAQA